MGGHATALAVVVLLGLAGLSGCGASRGVPRDLPLRIVPTRGTRPSYSVVGMNGRLFGVNGESVSGPSNLVSSLDGVEWEVTHLPHQTPTSALGLGIGLRRAGRMLTLVGSESDPNRFAHVTIYAWTTEDGRTWRGGTVNDGPDEFTYPLVVVAGDRALIGISHHDRTLTVSRQESDGTWTPVPVAGLTLREGEIASLDSIRADGDGWLGTVSFAGPIPQSRAGLVHGSHDATRWTYTQCKDVGSCPAVTTEAGLQFRTGHTGEVSVDHGTTWNALDITPPPLAEAETVSLRDAVRVGDGWLGVAWAAPPSDRSYGFLLHSTDGVHWQAVHHDPCPARGDGRPNSDYSKPFPLAGHWWSLYTCRQLIDADLALLLVGDTDGGPWTTAADLGSREPGGLVAVADHLVVPFVQRYSGVIDRIAIIEP